jgi:uncharacterized membrane protein YdjX (TVP38/TMEM64 family)
MKIFDKIIEHSIFTHLKENRNFVFLLLFFAVLPLVVSSSFIYFQQANQHLLAERTLPALVLFHLAAIPAMAFALTPTTFIAVISGYFFSWYGLAGILVSYPLAAVLGLKFGGVAKKLFLGDKFFRTPKIQRFLEKIREDEFTMNIFVRLSPVLPFAMTNVAVSVLKLSLIPFMAATMIGMFPRTFIFFLLGKDAPEIWIFVQNPTPEGLHRLIPLLLIIISTAGLLWVVRRTFSRMNEES